MKYKIMTMSMLKNWRIFQK